MNKLDELKKAISPDDLTVVLWRKEAEDIIRLIEAAKEMNSNCEWVLNDHADVDGNLCDCRYCKIAFKLREVLKPFTEEQGVK